MDRAKYRDDAEFEYVKSIRDQLAQDGWTIGESIVDGRRVVSGERNGQQIRIKDAGTVQETYRQFQVQAVTSQPVE